MHGIEGKAKILVESGTGAWNGRSTRVVRSHVLFTRATRMYCINIGVVEYCWWGHVRRDLRTHRQWLQ